MRLLTYDIDQEFIDIFQQKDLFICDIAEDLFDALYHCEVRFYNLILIKQNSLEVCKSFLKFIDFKKSAFVVLSENSSKEFELELLKKGAMSVIHLPSSKEYILAKLESIHRDNFAQKINYKNKFYIDSVNRCVRAIDDKEINISGKTFDILSYLIKNKHRPPLSKDEIMSALWEEPEMISDNVVEVNINQLRKVLLENFSINFINTVRNRGYRIAS